ncbi:MAG TPA: hypothetical protein VI387_11690 [Candidatus Brocadiales bacterium]|nr:hypothetical protein [Candidatus Brocadiales bacterium]
MMSKVNLPPGRGANWNEDPCLATLRRRISAASRRKMVMRYITITFIIALGVGIIKEAAYLVAMLCR